MNNISIQFENLDIPVSINLAKLLEDKKALSVCVLNVSELSQFTDTFVIVTGQSLLHLHGLQTYATEFLEQHGYKKRNPSNAYLDSPWVLLDFGDIIVHLFTEEAYEFYHLETIWKEAPVLYKYKEEK